MQIMKVRIAQLWEAAIYIIIVAICSLTNVSNQMIAVMIIAIDLYGLYKARKNWYIAYIFLCFLYSNYSICYANYFYRPNSMFVQWADTQTSHVGMLILMGFSMVVSLMIPVHMKECYKNKFALIKNNKSNYIITIGICVILVFILIFGYTRPSVAGGRGVPTSYYEYSLILFILGFYYSGKNQWGYVALSGLMALYALQNFMFGGRITGIQMVVCWIFCTSIDRIKMKKLIPFGIAFVIAMITIGRMRGNISFSIAEIKNTIESMMASGGTLDTAYSSYYTSLTFLKVRDQISIMERLDLFGRWLLSIVFGSVIPNSNLAKYTRNFYPHYSGGVLPFFGYFYLGIIGVLMFCYMVVKWIKKIAKTDIYSSGLARCLSIYVTLATFRWYLYSPSQITRGVLILCVLYGACYWFDNM